MPIIVNTPAEIDPLVERVRAATTRTAQALARLTAEERDGLRVLRRLKFTEMAWHPIDDRPLNLVEQINQTWPYLVTLKALPILFERHPEAGGFRLNLGTEGGTDIESLSPNVVAAETFAAVHPSNNGKLMKEVWKLVRERPEGAMSAAYVTPLPLCHQASRICNNLELRRTLATPPPLCRVIDDAKHRPFPWNIQSKMSHHGLLRTARGRRLSLCLRFPTLFILARKTVSKAPLSTPE
jgi:hypothetical protein